MRLVLAAVLTLVATTAGAAAPGLKGSGVYGTAGCGLGSLVFGNQPGGIQIIAATLNGTGVQTFGITTGTSNCQPGLLASGTKNFVEANREVVAKDIARGEGETVTALAYINQCADPRAVGAALQKNFSAIFPSEKASNDDVTAAILTTLHQDPALRCAM